MTELVVATVFASVMLVARLVPALRSRSVAEGVAKWSQQFGLTVTDGVRPFLLRRRRATWIGYAIGLALGIEAGSVLQHSVTEIEGTLLGGFAMQICWLVLGGLGVLVGGTVGASLVPATGPRVARDRAVTLADYVDPIERGTPLVAAAAAGAIGIVPLLRGATGGAAATAAGAGLAGVLVVGITEVLAILIVTRPQRADSPHLLAWTDALRADTARATLDLGSALAAGTLLVSTPAAAAALGTGFPHGRVELWVLVGLAAVAIPFSIRASLIGPTRYFLRRLWPKVAAELDEPARPMEVQP